MPHIVLAAKAIVNKPVLVYSDSAINSWHQVFMAVLAKPFLERRRNPDFIFHCNPSCHLYIFVRNLAVFLEHFLGMLEQEVYALFSYFLLMRGFFIVFFGHFCLNVAKIGDFRDFENFQIFNI